MRLLATEELTHFETRLAAGLDRTLAACDGIDLSTLTHVINRYVTRGGKRIRPQLCLWSCRAASGPVTDAAFDVAAVWEIFHAFLLVHDDVIDGADTRRGMASLHRQFQSLDHDSPVFGRNLAIVAGDLLFGVAIQMLAEIDAPPSVVTALMKLFSRIACTTGRGQAVDLLQSQVPLNSVRRDEVLNGYRCKTAAYTFEGPLVSGALLAGASPQSIVTITHVARLVGQAYQIHNDLIDLSTPAHDGCDLIQGKRTVTLMTARDGMTSDDRRSFDEQFARLPTMDGRAVASAESLRRRVHQTDAIGQTHAMVDGLLTDAASTADAAADVSLGRSLSTLVDALRSTLALPVAAV